MHFKLLDEEVILRAIDGYENELAKESARLKEMYEKCSCPGCGGKNLLRFMLPGHVFSKSSDTFAARSMLRCRDCSLEFDPHSSIIVSLSEAAQWNRP